MKKNLFFCMLLSINFFVFSEGIVHSSLELKEIPEQEHKFGLKTSITVPFMDSFATDTVIGDSVLSYNYGDMYANLGLLVLKDTTNITGEYVYMPFKNKNSILGFGGLYHINIFYDEFTEHDIELGFYFSGFRGNIFSLNGKTGFCFKLTNIKDVYRDGSPVIFGCSFFVNLQALWKITDWFETYLGLESTTFYDYPLLGTPYYTVGTNFNIGEKVTLGLDCRTKWVDMFSTSSYISQVYLDTYVMVRF